MAGAVLEVYTFRKVVIYIVVFKKVVGKDLDNHLLPARLKTTIQHILIIIEEKNIMENNDFINFIEIDTHFFIKHERKENFG